MSQIPRLFRRFIPQLLHMIALPLFFFAFVLVYRPFGLDMLFGSQWFGVHVTILACIILASVVLMRLLYFFLPLRINYTLYIFWCVAEVLFMSFFSALYLWLALNEPMQYFDFFALTFKYNLFTLIIPYSLLALSIRVYDYHTGSNQPETAQNRMRFYDSKHNLKFVAIAETILYIAAEENYINIHYNDEGKNKCYVLRNSMKSVEELCLTNGLVRCHRSYYINPSHIRILRKDKEGVMFAELDVDDVQDIPVSRKFYNNLAEML